MKTFLLKKLTLLALILAVAASPVYAHKHAKGADAEKKQVSKTKKRDCGCRSKGGWGRKEGGPKHEKGRKQKSTRKPSDRRTRSHSRGHHAQKPPVTAEAK